MKRKIKIQGRPILKKWRQIAWIPEIRISGKYLAEHGFFAGMKIEVELSHNQITIRNGAV